MKQHGVAFWLGLLCNTLRYVRLCRWLYCRVACWAFYAFAKNDRKKVTSFFGGVVSCCTHCADVHVDGVRYAAIDLLLAVNRQRQDPIDRYSCCRVGTSASEKILFFSRSFINTNKAAILACRTVHPILNLRQKEKNYSMEYGKEGANPVPGCSGNRPVKTSANRASLMAELHIRSGMYLVL